MTSKDIDFAGRPDQARICAELLGGQAKMFPPPSLTRAEVYFRDSDGLPRVIDFLTSPGGVDGREVIDTAVPITISQTGANLLVMAPVLCLQSRIYNVMTLRRESELSLAQVRASIVCARSYSRELLDGLSDDGGPREVLAINERIARLAREDPDWISLPSRHPGIDPFDSILLDPRLPAGFAEHRYPQLRAAIDRARRH